MGHLKQVDCLFLSCHKSFWERQEIMADVDVYEADNGKMEQPKMKNIIHSTHEITFGMHKQCNLNVHFCSQ